MKFVIHSINFRDALKSACEVVPNKAIVAEDSCIFLCAHDNTLKVSARDQNTDIELIVPCQVQEEGETLAPSRMLLDYISLANGSVAVSVDTKQRMTIKSGKKTSTLACMDTDRFKPMAYAGEPLLAMSGSVLATSIARTSFCTGTDESRQSICGVRLSVNLDGDIVFVGMDGFKISRCEVGGARFMDNSDAPHEFTIPNAVLKLITSLFGCEEMVTVNACVHRASICGGNKTLAFPLYVRQYPPYESLIPNSYQTETRIDSRSLLEALRLVEVAASSVPAKDGRWNICRVKVDGENGCIVLTSDSETSSAETFVDCDVQGADMQINFNVRYLKDIASACAKESDSIGFCLSNAEGVACMKPLDCAASMNTYIAPVRRR